VTRRASSAAGNELRSGIGGIGPCILWEKARPVLIWSYKSRFPCPWSCSGLSFLLPGVLAIIFWRRLLLVVACGSHGASKTENNSWQK
jgi:hypothetical protein